MALQDGAAVGRPEDVGAVLGALRAVGLTGQKLAVQYGDEVALAHQLAEYVGLQYEPWILDVVKGQVKDALDSLELNLRLSGSAATPGTQAVMDAVSHMARASEEEQTKKKEEVQLPLVLPSKGRMSKLKTSQILGGETTKTEEEKVIRILKDELVIMGAPIVGQMEATSNPARVQLALLGKYRASTVRRYLAYWQGFRKWVTTATGGVPTQGAQLVDYLLAREEEGMGASVPLSVSKAVLWFERLAGFQEAEMMSSEPLVTTVVRDLLKKLEEGAPPRRRAPRMLSCFIPALEDLVLDRKMEDRIRAGAWVKLVKIWASLRFDDLAHMRVSMVQSYDGKMSGLLKRTKTTGAGKRVKELPFHISQDAYVKHDSWLTVGAQALGRTVAGHYDLLVPSGSSQQGLAQDQVMAYQEAVGWSTDVMANLRREDGSRLVPDGWERFWTEHSERATLASGLAALGTPKTDRDLLGRWTPEGSDQYVRSYNAVVSRLQLKFAQPIRLGSGYTVFDEGSVLEELKKWLHEKWGVDSKVAGEAVDFWKDKLKPYAPFAELLNPSEEAKGEAEETAKAVALEESSDSSSSSGSSESETRPKKQRVEKLKEERSPGFLVVYNRIDRGKLHRAGAGGCWMAKSRKFKKADLYETQPEESTYTSRCKLCWPGGQIEESSSDSEDEIEATEPSEPVRDVQNADVYSSDLW